MGIISRFASIMEANVNALLDKCEDPAKMIDQTLRDLQEQLAEVKKETAGVMAEESAAKRRVDECQKEVNKYEQAAFNAVKAGNDGDAKVLLEKKHLAEQNLATAQSTYQVAMQNSMKMRQMYDKLSSDISELNAKRANIKAQVSMAKAQNRMTDIQSKVGNSNLQESFSRYEDKAQRMLDEATARAELSNLEGSPAENLVDKYSSPSGLTVDDELAAMKAKAGV